MAPATALAQVLLVVVFLPFADLHAVPGDDLLALAALGVGQIGLGLVFLTIGARLIPAAQVALITLLEVVLGPLWVWLAVDERPSTATLVGGAIVVAAGIIQARGSAPPRREEAAVPVR
jgi:drug/metabolite transporter (DMT)-like permease